MKKIKIFTKKTKRMPKVSDEIILLKTIKGKRHIGAVESSDVDGFVVRLKSTFVAIVKDNYKNVLYKHENIIYRAW
jgi:hypothetical protein